MSLWHNFGWSRSGYFSSLKLIAVLLMFFLWEPGVLFRTIDNFQYNKINFCMQITENWADINGHKSKLFRNTNPQKSARFYRCEHLSYVNMCCSFQFRIFCAALRKLKISSNSNAEFRSMFPAKGDWLNRNIWVIVEECLREGFLMALNCTGFEMLTTSRVQKFLNKKLALLKGG